ncbi:MAG: DUF488 domain-containing protein [Methanoregula sp.]|jgi:uncharacterized protein (DUF488 family)|nr:DUF488 domain-containing protein [Methanoregula sp.]
MKLFTIGFTKKDARTFFGLLIKNNVKTVIDIRLNNHSQLAGFSKGNDLGYFLKAIAGIDYFYFIQAAPEESLLKKWQKGEISWPEYEVSYKEMLVKRNVIGKIDAKILENGCLLCSESTAEQCHRRLLAEYLRENVSGLEIVHI